MTRRSWGIVLSLLLTPSCVLAQDAETVTVIRGGRLVLDPSTTPEPGEVLIRGGRIVAVGTSVDAPASATVVDASGHLVAPLFIDAGNSGLLGAESQATGPLGPGDRVVDVLDLFDDRSRRQILASGVGVAYLEWMPQGRNNRGPTGAVAWLDPNGLELPLLSETGGVTFTVGGRNQDQTNVTLRQASVRNITTALSAAERYKTAKEKYEKEKAEYDKKLAAYEEAKKKGVKAAPTKDKPAEENKPTPARTRPARGRIQRPPDFDEWPIEKKRDWMREQMSRPRPGGDAAPAESSTDEKAGGKPKLPTEPRRDPGSESMMKVLAGKAPLRVEAHWEEDIDAVLKIAREKKLRLVLLGASEAWRLTDRIKEAGASVVVGPGIWFGGDVLDVHGGRPDLARRLHAAGIPIAFMTCGASGYRHDSLRLLVQLAIAEGLAPSAAWDALTTGAARVLGVEDRVGRLAVGQDAALQIMTGDDPLAPDSRPVRVVLRDTVIEMGARRP
jgi:hypothetical protein